MGTAWKKGNNIFRLFLNFQQHPFDIDEKQVEIPAKTVSSLASRVQNDFSTISSSWDMNNMFLADHVTFLNRP